MAETMEQKPIEITLGDGSKIVGANMEEAIQNAVKRIEDRTKDLKTQQEKATKLQADVDAYKATDEERKAESDRQRALEQQKKDKKEGGLDKTEYYRLLNEDPIAAQNYLDSVRLGVSDPSQVPGIFTGMSRKINEIDQERVASTFWRNHPEFPQEMSAAKMLDKRVGLLIQEGHPFSVRTFNMAYDELVAEEGIKPMELEDDKKKEDDKKRKEDEKPNPSLSGASGGTDDAELRKFENMSMNDLEKIGREKGWVR
jgi:hypothetical protein